MYVYMYTYMGGSKIEVTHFEHFGSPRYASAKPRRTNHVSSHVSRSRYVAATLVCHALATMAAT